MSAAMILEPPTECAADGVDYLLGRDENETMDLLLGLQLDVARRADELARRCGTYRFSDRRLWLRAEQEIFERAENAARVTAR